MPTYEYRCKKCDSHLEVVQSFTDDPLTKHETCGGELRKVFAAPGISFKGSGFYKTDSRGSNGAKGASSSSSETSSESSSSSDSGAGKGSEKASSDTASSGAKSGDKKDKKKADSKAPASTT